MKISGVMHISVVVDATESAFVKARLSEKNGEQYSYIQVSRQ